MDIVPFLFYDILVKKSAIYHQNSRMVWSDTNRVDLTLKLYVIF